MTSTSKFGKINNCHMNKEVLLMFYDEKQALKACEEDASLTFNLIREGYYELVDLLISNNKVDINICDSAGNDIMMRLLKAKQYDLVEKFMRKRNWNVNHQNLDGNTLGHILAKDSSISSLKILEKLTKKKDCILNIKNNKGETVLDKAINNNYIYAVLKILEDKRFNSIDVLSFKNLYKTYIKNTYYGKYSKLNNLEVIVESLEKKELVPSMQELLDRINDNMDIIKNEIMKNKSLILESIIDSSLVEV